MVETVARRQSLQSLERGLAVIHTFSREHPSLTLSEVARLTGMTRATARRILLPLQQLGHARSGPRARVGARRPAAGGRPALDRRTDPPRRRSCDRRAQRVRGRAARAPGDAARALRAAAARDGPTDLDVTAVRTEEHQ